MTSPYAGLTSDKWTTKTNELIQRLPLTEKEIVDTVLACWNDIFVSKIGIENYSIGKDIFPTPQIMGALLHELIPIALAKQKKGQWRVNRTKQEKDIVCITNPELSIEIKTSSHKTHIAGNRSYAQKNDAKISSPPRKTKSGYYLTINFEKFEKPSQKTASPKEPMKRPEICQISLGWIDHEDWTGQVAPTGQSASISEDVYKYKLKRLYTKDKSP